MDNHQSQYALLLQLDSSIGNLNISIDNVVEVCQDSIENKTATVVRGELDQALNSYQTVAASILITLAALQKDLGKDSPDVLITTMRQQVMGNIERMDDVFSQLNHATYTYH